MTAFQGSLQLIGDPEPPVDGEVIVEGENIALNAGGQLIGAWPLEDVSLQRKRDGFHIGAEGEELVFHARDPRAFAEAVGLRKPSPEQPQPEEQPKPTVREARRLAVRQSRQRWVIGAGVVFLGLSIFEQTRQPLAALLVIAAVVGILVAVIAMIEPLVAAKLPGKVSPTRLLIGGLVVLMLGMGLAAI